MDESYARLADIKDRLADACGVLNVAHARLVELTAELIETELWRGYGIRSVEHDLMLQTGLSPERARQVVEVAAATVALPVTTAKLAEGALSFEQVHAVTQHQGKFNDDEAASFATIATVPQIRRTLSRYTFTPTTAVGGSTETSTQPAASDRAGTGLAAEAAAPGRVTQFQESTRWRMVVDAPADQGALIAAALAEAKDALFGAGQPNVSFFDALVQVCNRSLSTVQPACRADKYRVYVHLDTNGGWVGAGPALPPGLVAKLTCTGQVAPVWQTDGLPVNVGRSMRIVPDRTRRLVEDRDRGCRYPGCVARSYLEVHHIIHWKDGGPTDTWNLLCLCPYHHDAHHRSEFTLTGNADAPDGLTFTDSHGNPITIGRPRPPDDPLPTPPDGHRYAHPIGEPVQHKWVHFTPPSKIA